MKVISSVGFACLTVVGFHTGAAYAQQAPPPPPASPAAAPAAAEVEQGQYPPGYSPPPGYAPPPAYAPPPPPPPAYGAPRGYGTPPAAYGPPPGRYSYYPPPPPAPPPRLAIDRSFQVGASLGLGGLYTNVDFSDVATGYSFRAGFGVAPRLQFLIGLDGAVAGDGVYFYRQNVYYGGLQAFLARQLFVRGGIGLGNIVIDDSVFLLEGKVGLGLTGTVGLELVQGYNWSLELAGQITGGFYKDERWVTSAVNVGINFF